MNTLGAPADASLRDQAQAGAKLIVGMIDVLEKRLASVRNDWLTLSRDPDQLRSDSE